MHKGNVFHHFHKVNIEM